MQPGSRTVGAIKVALFIAALVPFARFAVSAVWFPDSLGANPAEAITRGTGDWCLRFVLLTLTITPLRWLSSWHWLLRLRRMLGLFAFFYAVVHFSSFIAFDHVFDVVAILKDIVKRPFITFGFTGLLLMTPLAATSTNAMVRRLGARRWLALHRLIYPLAIIAVVHFWMMVKRDITEPAIYAVILAILLGARIVKQRREGAPAPAVSARRTG